MGGLRDCVRTLGLVVLTVMQSSPLLPPQFGLDGLAVWQEIKALIQCQLALRPHG